MPSGGKRPGAGRPIGSKTKATIEREEQVRLALQRQQEIDELRAQGASDVVASAKTAGRKLAKDVLDDFMHVFAGMAAYYQPSAEWNTMTREDGAVILVNANPHMNEGMFRTYAALARDTARDLAQYQSPKMSAVMVGTATVTKINIEGGVWDDDDQGNADNAGPFDDDVFTNDGLLGAPDPGGRPGSDSEPAAVSSVADESMASARPQDRTTGETEGAPLRKAVG